MNLNEIQREILAKKIYSMSELEAKEQLLKFAIAQAETSNFVKKWLPGFFEKTEDGKND